MNCVLAQMPYLAYFTSTFYLLLEARLFTYILLCSILNVILHPTLICHPSLRADP